MSPCQSIRETTRGNSYIMIASNGYEHHYVVAIPFNTPSRPPWLRVPEDRSVVTIPAPTSTSTTYDYAV